jgi:hypothetical protein
VNGCRPAGDVAGTLTGPVSPAAGDSVFAVLIIGPPGAGKTAVLTMLIDALVADDVPHAAIEVEALAATHPEPTETGRLRHLRATCGLYREDGHQLLLLTEGVESDAHLARLLDATGAGEHFVVRLVAASAPTLARRIVEREPAGLPGPGRVHRAAPGVGDAAAHAGRRRSRGSAPTADTSVTSPRASAQHDPRSSAPRQPSQAHATPSPDRA